MSPKSIGLVLAGLWVAAIVWVVVLWQGGDGESQEPSPEAPPAVDVDIDVDVAPSSLSERVDPDQPQPTEVPIEEQPTDSEPEPAPLDPPQVVLGDPDPFERRILKDIFDPLEDAAERYAKHDELDESTFFGPDQESNQAAIDELLDQAIRTLGVAAINETRGRLREIREELDAAEEDISRAREARLSAPRAEELSTIERTLTTTREDLDARIEKAGERMDALERERVDLESQFVDELADIGLEISPETARGLLSTVSGEDFVEMCVVFHNVRLVTVRLQQLTEEAGESLDVARRYYGSYVVLVRILDTIQKDFIRRVREEQVPRLAEYQVRARENIAAAKRNAKDGGDPQIAEQNIRSNELTLDACRAYTRYLLDQAAAVERQNEALQPRLRDAVNTFDTVQLSSQVAGAIREARRNFAALLELDVPDLRGFENVELRGEFERLTDQLLEP